MGVVNIVFAAGFWCSLPYPSILPLQCQAREHRRAGSFLSHASRPPLWKHIEYPTDISARIRFFQIGSVELVFYCNRKFPCLVLCFPSSRVCHSGHDWLCLNVPDRVAHKLTCLFLTLKYIYGEGKNLGHHLPSFDMDWLCMSVNCISSIISALQMALGPPVPLPVRCPICQQDLGSILWTSEFVAMNFSVVP